MLQRDKLLMLTAVLLWRHQLPRKGTSAYFATNPTGCQVHIRRHPFSDIFKKNFANKWSRSAASAAGTSLFIEDKYRLNVFISLAAFLSFRGFAL